MLNYARYLLFYNIPRMSNMTLQKNCNRWMGSSPQNLNDEDRPQTKFEKKLAESKIKLKWRTPYNERENEWYSKFKTFAPDKNENTDIIAFLQQPIDLSFKAMQDRKERKRVSTEKFMQQFITERHEILGNDLAAAHFLVHRGGSVKYD